MSLLLPHECWTQTRDSGIRDKGLCHAQHNTCVSARVLTAPSLWMKHRRPRWVLPRLLELEEDHPCIASSKHAGCFYPGRRHCRTPKSAHSKLSAEKWSGLCLLGQLAGRVGHSHAGLPPNTTQGYFAIKIAHTLNFWPRNTTSRNLSYTFTCTGTK